MTNKQTLNAPIAKRGSLLKYLHIQKRVMQVINMEDSEITVYEEDEEAVLDMLEEEEEIKKEFTQEELFEKEEEEPTELEELFPDAPYTVYYQET